MDHKLSYRGIIWVIQKPNIKFSDRFIMSLNDTSPNSLFFFQLKISPKIWIVGLAKIGQLVVVPENKP